MLLQKFGKNFKYLRLFIFELYQIENRFCQKLIFCKKFQFFPIIRKSIGNFYILSGARKLVVLQWC